MYRFRFVLISFFFFSSSISLSQNNKVIVKPEKVLYKSTSQTDLNLYFYRPLDFDNSKLYNCIIFFHGGGWNSGDYKQFERQSMYFDFQPEAHVKGLLGCSLIAFNFNKHSAVLDFKLD